jgi:SOS response regulatory protein OraA/RecX
MQDANLSLRRKLRDSGYKQEIIDKIIEYYNRE